jgi:inorganic pyrophosphatase
MAHFFEVYKDLEIDEVQGGGWDDLESAYAEIERAAARYQERCVRE